MATDTRSDSIFSLNPSDLFDDDAEYRHLCRLFEKQFGGGIFGPSKKTIPFASRRSSRRPYYLNPFKKTGYTEVYQNKNGIKITLDVQQFKVGELSIKIVDQCIVVAGKHKDRKDYHGFVSRSFTRKYFLPKAMDPSTLSAKLSLDGLLVVTAMSKAMPAPIVRVIDICCTRKRALATNTPNKGPTRAAARPAAARPVTPKPAVKLPKKGRASTTAKPQTPRPQNNGNAKPPASGNANPQPPKRSGKAQ